LFIQGKVITVHFLHERYISLYQGIRLPSLTQENIYLIAIQKRNLLLSKEDKHNQLT
jgi:hypothetical protein